MRLAGVGCAVVRADAGVAAIARELKQERKEGASMRRRLQALEAQIDKHDQHRARLLEGGRPTRNNPAATWQPVDHVANLQAELATMKRELCEAKSHRAYEEKQLREALVEIADNEADSMEAATWLLDKAEVHADVLLLQAALEEESKQLGTLRKEHADTIRERDEVIDELATARTSATTQGKQLEHLKERSLALTSINVSKAQLGKSRGHYVKPIPIGTPVNPRRHADELATAKTTAEVKSLKRSIPVDADPNALARALNETGMLELLQETKQGYAIRMQQGQELVDAMNSTWNATHAVQLKQDYLISDRDMDAYRYAMSHDMINGKPRPKVLMSNPHNKKQRILYAEPFPSRNKWAPIIANQEEQFGLIRSEGTDCTERNFPSVLQALVDRDAHQLANPDSYTSGTKKLKAVIGFDGADNFCHVLLGLIEYKEGVACESEIKRVALAVMMGDDHNPSLQNIFSSRLGPDIERYIKGEATVTLFGRATQVEITTCLDLSASCSMTARRCNASPHTLSIDPHLIIACGDDDTMDVLEAKYLKKMPWLDVNAVSDAHHPDAYPWKCPRKDCSYSVENDEEQLENLQVHTALINDKSKAGKAALAKTIKAHCEFHDQTKEFECVIFPSLHPRNNIVDYLHSLDLQLAQRLCKFSWMDPVVLNDRPELRDQLSAVLIAIDCALDMREKEVRDNNRKWFHGAVWHYDFVMGANKKSFGLDGNMLLLCLVCFGTVGTQAAAEAAAKPAKGKENVPSNTIVDDMDDMVPALPSKKKKSCPPPQEESRHTKILRQLFGHNTDKVRCIFESSDSYAELFNAFNDSWPLVADQTYIDSRAARQFRAASKFSAALKNMSNSRHKSRYVPMMYTAAVQTRYHGDGWRYSTRATEGRGARYKKYMRKVVCRRKGVGIAKIFRAVKGLQDKPHKFVAQGYNTSTTLQLMRLAVAQEESAHRTGGRTRLGRTGRKTLNRILPKWEEEALPSIGNLMDPEVLEDLMDSIAHRLEDDPLGLLCPALSM